MPAASRSKPRIPIRDYNPGPPSKISVLPPGLLGRVFEYVAGTVDHSASSSMLSKFYQKHLALTSTCRQWRHTAISHGQLWSTIVFARCRLVWIGEVIRRSKDCALTVIINLSESDSIYSPKELRAALTMILFQLYRVRTLEASLRRDTITTDITLPSLSQPAPLLRRLWISFLDFENAPSLFGGLAPPLLELSIRKSSLSWDTQLPIFRSLSKLTRLSLVSITPPPTLHQLLDLIRSTPNLIYLDIWDTLPATLEAPRPSTNPVSLPSLTLLRVQASPSGLTNFFPYVLLNPETYYTIHSSLPDSEFQWILPILCRFGREIKGQQVTHIQDLSIIEDPSVLKLQGHVVTPSTGRYQEDGLFLRLKHHLRKQIVPGLACGIAAALSLEHLRSMSVTPLQMSERQWRGVFGNLPELKSIVFLENHTLSLPVEFIKALHIHTDRRSRGVGVISFPRLVSLTFIFGLDSRCFESLYSALEIRKELGYPLKKVRFEIGRDVDRGRVLDMYQRLGLEDS
ncbi:hypothetical protein AX16_002322 [Volvariella volvacea WC 439]|nr:hypothetical protein AX16_002322 [Volvariella volvacea WC 439]